MRRILVAAIAATSLFVPATAMAGDPAPVADPPPEFVTPLPAPVVDNDTAGAFAKLYVARNAGRLLGTNRHRVRVLDVQSSCLQSPVLDTRFGCVFTLRALVIQRSRGWDDWGHSARVSSKRGRHGHNRHIRARRFGCLGFLRINGGPAVTPTAEVVNVECARIPRDDITVVEPV